TAVADPLQHCDLHFIQRLPLSHIALPPDRDHDQWRDPMAAPAQLSVASWPNRLHSRRSTSVGRLRWKVRLGKEPEPWRIHDVFDRSTGGGIPASARAPVEEWID